MFNRLPIFIQGAVDFIGLVNLIVKFLLYLYGLDPYMVWGKGSLLLRFLFNIFRSGSNYSVCFAIASI